MNFGAISQLFITNSPLIVRCSYLRTFACQLQRIPKSSKSWTLKYEEESGESDDQYRENLYNIGEDEDAEIDFTKLHKAHHQFERETYLHNENRDLKIAERKFFKTKKQPNLLTWEEKEQIRYLHNNDSEEWTVEKLSESFPATEETIKKIIKAKWNMYDPNKIRKHNDTVKKNWELLKEGKLEISESVKKHILKFTSRKRAVLPQPVSLPPQNLLPEGGEFGSIITEYQKRKEKTEVEAGIKSVETLPKSVQAPNDISFVAFGKNNKALPKSVPAPNDDRFLAYEKNNKYGRPVTLDVLRTKINERIEHGEETSLIDLTIVNNMKSVQRSGTSVENLSEKPVPISSDKEEKAVSSSKESSAVRLEHSANLERDPVPLRIRIPKHCWVRGATYKVEDRYYDDDGTFLYRVPGMK